MQVWELMRQKAYDVLAVLESWLNTTVTNTEVEIKGHKLTRLDRIGKTRGGVCIYTRYNTIQYNTILYLTWVNTLSLKASLQVSHKI